MALKVNCTSSELASVSYRIRTVVSTPTTIANVPGSADLLTDAGGIIIGTERVTSFVFVRTQPFAFAMQ